MSLHREFPQSPEAERGVLCCLMLAPVECRAICSQHGINADSFYLPAHAIIFDAFVKVIDSGKGWDFLTVLQLLRDAGNLEAVGGGGYLNEINCLLPSAANLGEYLDILVEKSIRRQVIAIATEAVKDAYAHGDGAETREIVEKLQVRFGALLGRKSTRPSIRDSLNEILTEVREGRDDTGVVKIPMAGIGDRLRLYRGDLLIISAPTSCGKSALAVQMALAACKGKEGRVACYPLEMRQRQVLKRAIAQLGGHNADFVRKLVRQGDPLNPSPGTLRIVGEFKQTVTALLEFPLHVRDDLFRWEHIRADLKAEHAKAPFSFVVIDYLQLIQGATKERRQLAIAELTQGAKNLAAELDCVICIPSQVNKDGGTREAQDTEFDCSALIKIHGKVDENGDTHPGRVSVWKQREGERHVDLPLKFNPILTRFEDASQ